MFDTLVESRYLRLSPHAISSSFQMHPGNHRFGSVTQNELWDIISLNNVSRFQMNTRGVQLLMMSIPVRKFIS